MPMAEKLVDWECFKILKQNGITTDRIASVMGISRRQLVAQMQKYNVSDEDISVPSKKDVGIEEKEQEPLQGDLLLPWSEIEEYLATGMTIEETAIACGVDTTYLKEQYLSRPEHKFESLDLYAAVLRARKTYELLKSCESRALNGDLRAFYTVLKCRYARHSKDCPKPPTLEKSGQI